MPSSVQKPEDWGPYEAEIRSLYLDQNWTLGKTMKHMELKYGFKATVRQYKRRFNKNKNLTAPEWIVIGKLIQKRSREGKRTDVFLYQRQVNPKKITRELARHKSQIDRAKTPVHQDNRVYGRTSFRTPPQSPRMDGQTPPSAEDDGDGLLWETYVATSPAGSIYSVSRVLRSNISDQEMEEVVSQRSTPSVTSEIDYSDLNQLEIQFWTFNLPIAQLQNYLRGQRYGSSPVLIHPLTPGQTVPCSISHSWSEDSLRRLLFESLPQMFDVAFPAGVPYGKTTSALEIALFAMTNNLFDYDPFSHHIEFRIRILKWFIAPAHLALMGSLIKSRNRAFSGFAHSFLRFSSDIFNCLEDDDEGQKRLIDIIHTLVTSRLPSNYFLSSKINRLLSIVAGCGRLDLVQFMVENGASVGPGSFHSLPYWDPLFVAAQNRRFDILQYLIDQGAGINFEKGTIRSRNHSLTVLGHALESDARSWDVDHSKEEPTSLTLLNYGADVNSRAFLWGATALDWAAFNAPQVYDRFVQHDPTIKAVASVVSLIGRAAHNGPKAVFSTSQQRIWSSLDLEQALIFAVRNGSIQVTQALLQANVDPNCASISNTLFQPPLLKPKFSLIGDMRYEDLYKPLRAALHLGTFELVELLVDFGAEITVREIDTLWERLSEPCLRLEDSTKIVRKIAQSCNRKLLGDLLLLVTYIADRNLLTSLLEMIEAEDFSRITSRQLFVRSRCIHISNHVPTFWFHCLIWTPLQMALARGDVTLARWLWDYGFRFHTQPNYPYSTGWYELKLACNFLTPNPLMCHLIDMFLEHGAIPNSPLIDSTSKYDRYNCMSPASIDTCLHSILREPTLGLIPEVSSLSKKFIEYGADLTRLGIIGIEHIPPESPLGLLECVLIGTVVQTACFSGIIDVVRLLVDAGANIHASASPDRGRTALQAACGSITPSIDLIQYLLDQKCDVNSPPADNYGVTALQAAAARGYVQIAINLLTAGADVNAPAGKLHGRTAIEAAAKNGRLDMVKLLINAGALGDIEAENRFHEAIRLANLRGHQHIVDLLREHE